MALESIVLRDPATGSTAKILPGFGFNCYSFQPVVAGETIEVLWSAPDFDSGQQRPSHSGIPLLFPFPGRLGGTQFTFAGKTYLLEAADGRGNAIHGFVLNRPWQIVEQSATRVVGRFHASKVDPAILNHWPADFCVTVTYELSGGKLASTIEILNPDSKPLPFGLGTHPYFRVPLGKAGKADDCRVTVPVSDYWPLENMLPTGKTQPATGSHDLAHGLRFADTKLDDVFSGLPPTSGLHDATIADPGSGRTLRVSFGGNFRAVVVYNPPHREAICIEPYSCIPDYFRLGEMGVDTNMVLLQPNQSVQYRVDIELS
jgi:aldose 1-epimerase